MPRFEIEVGDTVTVMDTIKEYWYMDGSLAGQQVIVESIDSSGWAWVILEDGDKHFLPKNLLVKIVKRIKPEWQLSKQKKKQ